MENRPSAAIQCIACGQESFLLREPKYDGFTRIGDHLKCAACGHEYDDEESVPFTHVEQAQVFSDADRSKDLEVFDESENKRLCLYCHFYLVNPFTQFCSHHKKEVEATDTCSQFKAKETPEKPSPL